MVSKGLQKIIDDLRDEGIVINGDGYEFPDGFPLQTRLKDVLEKDVDPKYYLKDTAKFFIKNSFDMEAKGNGFRLSPHVADNASIGKCITTRAGSRMDDNFTIDVDSDLESFEFSTKNNELMQSPKLDCLGMLDIKGNECIRRVYNSNGLSPTLTTMEGGNRQPKILEEPTIVASRGRYNEDGVVEQNLEFNSEGISNTLTTVQKDNYVAEPLLIKEATKKGYAEAYDGDSVNLEQPNSQTRRGRVGTQIANILMTSCAQGVVEGYRIRKLTPKECWNLMDFDADAFGKASPYISDSALYKQAGNSIVVACMEHIFNNLDIDKIKGGSNER